MQFVFVGVDPDTSSNCSRDNSSDASDVYGLGLFVVKISHAYAGDCVVDNRMIRSSQHVYLRIIPALCSVLCALWMLWAATVSMADGI